MSVGIGVKDLLETEEVEEAARLAVVWRRAVASFEWLCRQQKKRRTTKKKKTSAASKKTYVSYQRRLRWMFAAVRREVMAAKSDATTWVDVAAVLDGLLSRGSEGRSARPPSAAAESAARTNSASRLLAYGRRSEGSFRGARRLLGSSRVPRKKAYRRESGVPRDLFYAAIKVRDPSEAPLLDLERRTAPPLPASFPPSPRSRTVALRIDRRRRAHDLVVSRELLKVEVRVVYADEDDFGLSVARTIRARRAPPVFSPATAARGIDVSGFSAARLGGANRFASVRCAAPIPQGAWIYFQVRVDDDPFTESDDEDLSANNYTRRPSDDDDDDEEAAANDDDDQGKGKEQQRQRRRRRQQQALHDDDNDDTEENTMVFSSSLARSGSSSETKTTLTRGASSSRSRLVELAVGLAPSDLARTALCGLGPKSASIVSIGGLLVANMWTRVDRQSDLAVFRPGDTVGVLAYQDDDACHLCFDVNGQKAADMLTVPLLGRPKTSRGLFSTWRKKRQTTNALRLYPTVSFRTPRVGVHARFTADDIDLADPANLGAPQGEPVYALDGTRLV